MYIDDETISFKITQEEIDRLLIRGTPYLGGNDRILNFFAEPHSKAEKAEFLADEYGVGGMWPAHDDLALDYNGKGLRVVRTGIPAELPQESVSIRWAKAVDMIQRLIDARCYPRWR